MIDFAEWFEAVFPIVDFRVAHGSTTKKNGSQLDGSSLNPLFVMVRESAYSRASASSGVFAVLRPYPIGGYDLVVNLLAGELVLGKKFVAAGSFC